jgi:hypothetical protein
MRINWTDALVRGSAHRTTLGLRQLEKVDDIHGWSCSRCLAILDRDILRCATDKVEDAQVPMPGAERADATTAIDAHHYDVSRAARRRSIRPLR